MLVVFRGDRTELAPRTSRRPGGGQEFQSSFATPRRQVIQGRRVRKGARWWPVMQCGERGKVMYHLSTEETMEERRHQSRNPDAPRLMGRAPTQQLVRRGQAVGATASVPVHFGQFLSCTERAVSKTGANPHGYTVRLDRSCSNFPFTFGCSC